MTRVSFSMAWVLALAVLVGVGGVGVAMAADEPAPSEKPPEATVMPDWAPDHPSDEFLVGLRALAPVPSEQVLGPVKDDEQLTAFLKQMMETLWPPAYELFGSLTEEQRATFFEKSEVRLPASSLPESPRAALDRWYAAMDQMLAAIPEGVWPGEEGPPKGGYHELLRAEGAAEDLANVEVGFGARNGLVGVYFWVTRVADEPPSVLTNDFAMLKGETVTLEDAASEE